MKISHTPPAAPRYVGELDHPSSLHVLASVAQAGWVPVPEFTQTCIQSLERRARWIITASVPGFPPGVGLGPTRIAAKRRAADRLLHHIRPTVNFCIKAGREMYKTKPAAHAAVERQQMLALGKPLTGEFRCSACGYWHTTGSGTKATKRLLKARKKRPQLPWNARPLQQEATVTAEGEQVIIVTAGLGANAPAEHVGQHVALILRKDNLTRMLAAFEEPPSDDTSEPPLVYAPPIA